MPDTIDTPQDEADAHKIGFNLKRMSNDEIDGLLSSILMEMRRRDMEHVKGDVVAASSRALRRLRSSVPEAS